MKTLTISLISVVVIAVIGLGWLLGQLYFRLESNTAEYNGEMAGYQVLGRGLANTLDNLPNKEQFIQTWQVQKSIAVSLQSRSDFPIPGALQEKFDSGEPLVLRSDNKLSMHFYMPNSGQVISFDLPEDVTSERPPILSLSLTLLFYVGIVAIVLIWLYPLIRRLSLLKKSAQAFGMGDMTSRIDSHRTSYISDIETEFNRMADRIQTLVADNKLLSQAVSHDLKTPLARLRFGIDAIEETKDSVMREKYFRRLNKDIDEMDALINRLLQYARLDEANIQVNTEGVDLKALILDLCGKIDNPNIVVEYRLPENDPVIESDVNHLTTQLNNLLSNAFKNAETKILLSLEVKGNCVSITVEDDGNGIPLNQRKDAIKPFWRGDNKQGRDGHGLGLSIVARIAEWLDQELIIADSKRLGGAAVSLRFNNTVFA